VILVDSSVWVDYFRGTDTRQTRLLDAMLGNEPVAIGDLILIEVLQGVAIDREFESARRMLAALEQVVLGGPDIAVRAARHHRLLRARGVTVRKTIDIVIATRCIVDDIPLLHADRDFDPFETHLGLKVVA